MLWLQDRGLLEQQEYDFLKAVQGIGAYERGLRAPRRAATELAASIKPGCRGRRSAEPLHAG